MNFEEYLSEATNQEVIDKFAQDSFSKDKKPVWGSTNLKIRKEDGGWSLVNYSTPIAYRENDTGRVWLNKTKYSVTTSKIQSWLRSAFSGNKEVQQVEGKELQKIIDEVFELEQEK